MAYRRATRTTRRSRQPARASRSRVGYRANKRPTARYSKRPARKRSATGRSAGIKTIRIVIEQPKTGDVSRPADMLVPKVEKPTKAKF
jgi:hypothetical protein